MQLNFLLPGFGLSGGVKVVLRVASGLAAGGHDVQVSAPGRVPRLVSEWMDPRVRLSTEAPADRAQARLVGLLVRGVHGPSARDDLRSSRLRPLVARDRLNIATAWATSYAVAADATGPAAYYLQHEESIMESDELQKLRARVSLSLPLTKLANSTWLANRVESLTRQRPPVVVPGVDPREFFPASRPAATEPLILTFADRRPFKGYADVVEAFDIVAQARPDVRFAAFGSQPEQLKPKVARVVHHVAPTGQKLADLYRAATVFVLGSWAESSPLQPLEAMACGTPVIATQFGVEDYLGREGETIRVVPPRSPVVLADAILELLSDTGRMERLREAGIEASRRFTWERTVAGVEGFLTSLT